MLWNITMLPPVSSTLFQIFAPTKVPLSPARHAWSTKKIPLQVGVYKGDSMSVIIFNTVMATLGDALAEDRSLGYTFSHSG